ncbi:MAG: hypothetical protein R3A48_10770 [Polyangiales bacterium]
MGIDRALSREAPRRRLLGALGLVSALGCGSAGDLRPTPFTFDAAAFDLPPVDAVAVSFDAAVQPEDSGDYPPGPYGAQVGQTLANLSWEGYANPDGQGLASARPYGPTSLSALRGERRGFALIFNAEFL